jgi:hypothetical protein
MQPINGAEHVYHIEDKKIQQILNQHYQQYESPIDTQKKYEILTKLQQIIIEWI